MTSIPLFEANCKRIARESEEATEWRSTKTHDKARSKTRPQEGSSDSSAVVAAQRRRSGSVGVGARTLYRWMNEPDFDAAYRAARRAAFSQSAARLQQMSTAAVSTLGKIMVDPNAPAASRVRAADSVLDHAAKAIEIEDIEARVSELERAAEQSK
jgi:hypothetical protein